MLTLELQKETNIANANFTVIGRDKGTKKYRKACLRAKFKAMKAIFRAIDFKSVSDTCLSYVTTAIKMQCLLPPGFDESEDDGDVVVDVDSSSGDSHDGDN